MTQRVNNTEYFGKSFDKPDLPLSSTENTTSEEVNVKYCHVTFSQFSCCKLIESTLNHGNLRAITIPGLRCCEINGEVNLNLCKPSGINRTAAYWPVIYLTSGVYFYKSLTTASFLRLKFYHLKTDECRLHKVDFREYDLSRAEITHCDLAGSLFNNTHLCRADFTDSWNFRIGILKNSVTHAKFFRREAISPQESLDTERVDE